MFDAFLVNFRIWSAVGSSFILLQVGPQLSQHHGLKRPFSPQCTVLALVTGIQLHVRVCLGLSVPSHRWQVVFPFVGPAPSSAATLKWGMYEVSHCSFCLVFCPDWVPWLCLWVSGSACQFLQVSQLEFWCGLLNLEMSFRVSLSQQSGRCLTGCEHGVLSVCYVFFNFSQ